MMELHSWSAHKIPDLALSPSRRCPVVMDRFLNSDMSALRDPMRYSLLRTVSTRPGGRPLLNKDNIALVAAVPNAAATSTVENANLFFLRKYGDLFSRIE